MKRKKKILNKTQRLPWPEAARRPYGRILKLHELLVADLTVAIERGTQTGNFFIIENALGFITESSTKIIKCCLEIQRLLPEDRIGRYPKWFTVAQEIEDLAREIQNFPKKPKVRQANREQKVISLESYFETLQKEEVSALGQLLKDHPYRSELNPWIEVEDFVEKAFEEKS